jgi:hypothetical protein
MTPRIEVWHESTPGPNARRQFHFFGLYHSWTAVFALMGYNDLHLYWAIRTVERPHPGAVQLLLCLSPYNTREI